MVSLLLLCGLSNPSTICSRIADGVLSDVWAAMKSSQFGATPRYVVPGACAATHTDLKNWNGREQCEGVRRGWSCVSRHDDRSTRRGHEGTILDHSRDQQHRVQPRMRMLARRCTTSVSCYCGMPELHLEHYQVGVSDGMLSFREMCFRI